MTRKEMLAFVEEIIALGKKRKVTPADWAAICWGIQYSLYSTVNEQNVQFTVSLEKPPRGRAGQRAGNVNSRSRGGSK